LVLFHGLGVPRLNSLVNLGPLAAFGKDLNAFHPTIISIQTIVLINRFGVIWYLRLLVAILGGVLRDQTCGFRKKARRKTDLSRAF
jgi:hypothetical protein